MRMMEMSLQESGERVAEKEKGLDTRIQEIMRLESRLHEALEEKQHRAASTESEQSDNNNSKSTGKEQEEREAALVVQEDVRRGGCALLPKWTMSLTGVLWLCMITGAQAHP